MEKEADAAAVGYIVRAGIDPVHFANMMTRLSTKTDAAEGLQWLNSHPNSIERASNILKQKKDFNVQVAPLMNDSAWHYLQRKANQEIE